MILEYVYKTNILFKLVTETGSRVTIWGRRGRMVVGQLPMQSVPITTNVVSSNPTQVGCTRYNIM